MPRRRQGTGRVAARLLALVLLMAATLPSAVEAAHPLASPSAVSRSPRPSTPRAAAGLGAPPAWPVLAGGPAVSATPTATGTVAATATATITATSSATVSPTQTPPLTPTTTPSPTATASLTGTPNPFGCGVPYLSTSGNQIVDGCHRTVRLRAVNWYGFDSNDFVAGGLHDQTYRAIVDRIKGLGYNALRLPFSNELVERNPVVSDLTQICAQGACLPISGADVLGPNADLRGLHALDILKTIVDYAGAQGLYVILDDHRTEAGWGPEENGLWYTPAYSADSWLADWKTLGALFAGDPAVVGLDLRNEPHWVDPTVASGPAKWQPADCAAFVRYAHWGPCDGLNNAATDWAQAATTAGNALLSLNPHWLIIVEGGSTYPQAGDTNFSSDGWGMNLQGVRADPIDLSVANQLVYEAHDYRWYQDNSSAGDMQATWNRDFGFVAQPGQPYTAPLWMGEFGTCTWGNMSCVRDAAPPAGHEPGWWFSTFVDYLNNGPDGPLSWGYWPVDGTYSDAWSYSANVWETCYGQRETYGILGADWATLSNPLLQSLLVPGSADGSQPPTQWPDFSGPLSAAQCIPSIYQQTHQTPTATPVPASTPTPIPTPTATASPQVQPRVVVPSPTPTPRPTPLPVTIHLGTASVRSHQALRFTGETAAQATLSVSLDVTGQAVVYAGTGASRHVVYAGTGKTRHPATQTVSLYHAGAQLAADARGHFAGSITITYAPRHATHAFLTVTALAGANRGVVTASLTILPPAARTRAARLAGTPTAGIGTVLTAGATDGQGPLYVATTRGLYRSLDASASRWARMNTVGDIAAISADPRRPDAVLYTRAPGARGDTGGLYLSADGGKTARRVDRCAYGALARDAHTPSIVYAGAAVSAPCGAAGHARIARSSDGGRSWHVVYTAAGQDKTAGITNIVVDPWRTTRIYAVIVVRRGAGALVASTDGGRTWHTLRNGPHVATAPSGIAIGLGDALWAAWGSAGLYRSGDGGRTWSHVALPSGATPGDVRSDPVSERVYVAATLAHRARGGSASAIYAIGPGGVVDRFGPGLTATATALRVTRPGLLLAWPAGLAGTSHTTAALTVRPLIAPGAWALSPALSGAPARTDAAPLGDTLSPTARCGGAPCQYFARGALMALSGSQTRAVPLAQSLLASRSSRRVSGSPAPVTYADLARAGAHSSPPPPGFAGGAAPVAGGVFVPASAIAGRLSGYVVPVAFWAHLQDRRAFPHGWRLDLGTPLTPAVSATVTTGRSGGRRILIQAFQGGVLVDDPANPAATRLARAAVGLDYAAAVPAALR